MGKKEMHNPEVVVEDGLLVVHENDAELIFSSEDVVQKIVDMIKEQVAGHTPDLSTNKGRKEIASLAMQVSKSKVVLDNLGKDLVSGWKSKAKVVDQLRKVARDQLEDLRDHVRQPLSDWEEEEKRKAAEELERLRLEKEAAELAAEIERCHGEALLEDEVQTLRKEKAAREREEQERLRKEREEQERKEREERIREEERKRVEREAAEKQREAEEEAERKVREAEAEAERKVQAEKARLAKEQREKEERERKERERKQAEEAERQRKANLKRNQNKKKREAVLTLVELLDVDKVKAEAIVEAISNGFIPNLQINY